MNSGGHFDTDESALARVVGQTTFSRGLNYARNGAVLRVQWNKPSTRVFGEVRGNARRPYTALADLNFSTAGRLTGFRGSCTCPVGTNCKHAVALALAAIAGPHPSPSGAAPEPRWERTLRTLLGDGSTRALDSAAGPDAEVGLQFEPTRHQAGPAVTVRIGVRPVRPGRNGSWVRTGISWSGIGYTPYHVDGRHAAQLRLLGELLALSGQANHPGYYSRANQPIFLDAINSRRLWDVLDEARELGLPLVCGSRRPTPVRLVTGPVRASLDLTTTPDGLQLAPRLFLDDTELDPRSLALIGSAPHGVAWWPAAADPAATPTELSLARLAPTHSTGAALRTLLDRGPVDVPPDDVDRFLTDYAPALRETITLESSDGSVALPEPSTPQLVLALHADGPQQIDLAWSWRTADQSTPLDQDTGQPWQRHARRRIHDAALAAAVTVPDLVHDDRDGTRLRAECTVTGMAAVRLATTVLPRLAQLDDVVVEGADTLPEYRESAAPAVIDIADDTTGQRDWFDLAVSVSVDGEQVPFQALFVSIAAGEQHLVLPSGTYFSLDRPEFAQLAELIAESRALNDAPPGMLRVNRYQADTWAELARLGVISGQAAQWQQTVQQLSDAHPVEQPVPTGVDATLRGYQHSGYDWLVFLHEHGLGGILADDMGLGKTLQALALIAHAREQRRDAGPFLVVAPTSVVANWAVECARFVPGLRTVTITETARRRGTDVAEAVRDADIVITSYTLFRLEFDAYDALEWSGLFLDEAQFVKNHQSQGYRCAKQLTAGFKLAITGTPLENNLMELWSLCSITAPGLLGGPERFEKYYRGPVERERDTERLGQLRRRIRPLVLRRSKAEVLTELPDKQEQVVELELNPRHRRIYQRHLQRERQKVLGLLGDLEQNRFEIFRSLTLLRQASLSAALVDEEHAHVPSTKLDALMQQLDSVVNEGHRVLVFSQFTRFLHAARARLDAAGIEHCYLDGKTRKRASVLDRFKTGAAPVFLVSLKAGGFGLNLTEADYCILLDPWWNPATEAQAVDRVHRIGQTRKVMVYRLVAKDTIEEKVMALKAAKAALFSSVLAEGTFAETGLSAADIRALVE